MMVFKAHYQPLIEKLTLGKSIKHNSKSVNSMFLTLEMFKNGKNIEITDLELCLIDFPS
jgi:hypothetical protein